MASRKRSSTNAADSDAVYKEWDKASFRSCIDQRRDAIRFLCISTLCEYTTYYDQNLV